MEQNNFNELKMLYNGVEPKTVEENSIPAEKKEPKPNTTFFNKVLNKLDSNS